ncbi:MAG: hypothetical protein M1819_007145 [Sarea resinae]|nr:MAG: hypothetical protein M1819_007145 [Sarea resinae]
MAEILGAVQSTAGGLLSKGQGLLDRFFPPEKREIWKAKLMKFATEKPKLASFLLSQLAITGLPLVLFVVMTIGVFVFSLVVALVVGVLAALLFTAFCVGVALLVLLPTLFVTTFGAAFIWLWGVGAYYIMKAFNKVDIPGLSKGDGDGETSPLPDLNGLTKGQPDQNGSADKKNDGEKKSNGEQNDHANDHKKTNGEKPSPLKKTADVGKTTGDVKKTADVGKTTDTVKKTANVDKAADVGNATKGVGDVKNKAGGLAGGAL